MTNLVRKVLLVVAILHPLGAQAQLVPTPAGRSEATCPDRPAEPALLAEMDFREREAFGILLKNMYKASAYNEIVPTSTCDCSQRFPEWDDVVADFVDQYAGQDDRNYIRERETFYLRYSNTNRATVRDICEAAGNW